MITTTTTTIIIIKIIIILAFKGENQEFFFSILTAPSSSGLGAIVCKSRAIHRALILCNMSCYIPHGTQGQLSY